MNINIPDHTILDKIGEGGMSAVYLGRQLSLQRKVAIKVLKKLVMEDKLLAERFVDEAKTVASLDHPHIISIYEAKKLPSGLAYFTMPYLTHGDFSEIICTNAEHLIDLLGQICDGLSHAHEHGVIHRDLKPDNILFDQFGRIKIADFGIAISTKSQRKTKETQLLGSAHYMSPEQIQSKPIDRRSDIYSLGCIIYEKITGDHVFSGNGDFSILMSHINKPIPILPPGLSIWQPIIDRCLAKDPTDRYQSVTDLKTDLMKIRYQDRSTESKPNKAQFELKKWALPISVVSLIMVVILFGILYSSKDLQPEVMQALAAEQPTAEEVTSQQTPTESQPPSALAKDPGQNDQALNLMETVITLPENQASDDNEPNLTALLAAANTSLKDFRLTKPVGDNAAEQFAAILAAHPDNTAARQGLHKVGLYYFSLINSKLDQQAYGDATLHINSLNEFINAYPVNMEDYQPAVSNITEQAIRLANQAIAKRRSNPQANDYIAMALALAPNETNLLSAQTNYQSIPKNGDLMTDLSGHQWVFVAAPSGVAFNDFWLAQNETTVAEFSAFAADKNYTDRCEHFGRGGFFKKTWDKPPFDQTTKHPVICLTAPQAQAYAGWLSKSQSNDYRLPTAAEWQWAQQKLNKSAVCKQANIAGQETSKESKIQSRSQCNDNFIFTAPVASMATAHNTYDLGGNVAEWVTGCGAKGDFCAAGGSWISDDLAKTTQLESAVATTAYSHIGFRLVKPLPK